MRRLTLGVRVQALIMRYPALRNNLLFSGMI